MPPLEESSSLGESSDFDSDLEVVRKPDKTAANLNLDARASIRDIKPVRPPDIFKIVVCFSAR